MAEPERPVATPRVRRRWRPAPPWGATATAVLVTGAVLLLTRGRFTTNDDALMRSIADGRLGGRPDAHLVFVGTVLGAPLALAYRLVPAVPWYGLLLNAAPCLAVGLVGSATAPASRSGRLRSALALGPPLVIVAVLQTFTAAAVLTGAAAVAVHHAGAPSRRRADVAGAGLLVLAASLRFDGALLGAGVAATVLVLGEGRPWARHRLRFAALALLALVAVRGVDAVAYRADDGWDRFARFNAARSQLHTTPRLQASPALDRARQEAGWTTTDLALFTDWLHTDPSRFTPGATQTVVDGTDGQTGDRDVLDVLHHDVWNPYAGWLLTATVGAMTLGSGRRRTVGAVLAASGLWVAVGTYVGLYQRFPARVALPALAALVLAAGATSPPPPRRARVLLAATGYAAVVAGALLHGTVSAGADARRLEAQVAAMDRLHPGGTFVVVGSALRLEGMSSLDQRRTLPARTLVLSWTNLSPAYDRQVAALGLTDVFGDLTRRNDVTVVVDRRRAEFFRGLLDAALAERGLPGRALVKGEAEDVAFLGTTDG